MPVPLLAPLLFGIGGAGIIFAKNAIDNKNYRKKREKQMADIIDKEAVYEAEALKKKQERERQKELMQLELLKTAEQQDVMADERRAQIEAGDSKKKIILLGASVMVLGVLYILSRKNKPKTSGK